MRISTITNLAYGITLLLTGISGTSFILAADAAKQERAAVEQHRLLDDLIEQLQIGAEMRTDEARLYVMRGAARHLAAFRSEERVEHSREQAFRTLRTKMLTPKEAAALDEAEAHLDALDRIELAAVAAMERGDQAAAQQAMFGPEHESAQAAILGPVDRFADLVAERSDAVLNDAQRRADWLAGIAHTMLALTALLFLAVLYFVLRRRVALPLIRMTGIVNRLARQDYDVDVPLDARRDEIGDMTQAIHIFRSNSIERDRLDQERAADQRVKDRILQMMHRLQACANQDELAEVVTCFAPQIFPGMAGHLYVVADHGASLTLAGSWLEPGPAPLSFPVGACWGLRRGRPHVSNRDETDIACPHISDDAAPSLCAPLTAQGDTIGLLHFEEKPDAALFGEASRLYLEMIAENIGLALANLRLRDRLTSLAVRDPLTGLLNRRCLDEALNRHAREPATRLACLMIDIDHFKRFNDEYGHDAGDAVMIHVARSIVEEIGESGSVYRFGGEEFTVLLPGESEMAAFERAEQLRERIGTASLAHRGEILGSISVSIGVADAPDHGPVTSLLPRADAALIDGKRKGRDRTVRASMLGVPGQDGSAAA
ncbi:diguanylate cyclase [Flavisphingomonas formosensis]|uniref:diguanylate cyclase n=1 Tax=Flavisphingomonas formosensis TaxID=861534 RepID=UPI0012F8566D|nr:diguanylate cyclase [Sphingomonas formosensis]